jgi:hypothetical protein
MDEEDTSDDCPLLLQPFDEERYEQRLGIVTARNFGVPLRELDVMREYREGVSRWLQGNDTAMADLTHRIKSDGVLRASNLAQKLRERLEEGQKATEDFLYYAGADLADTQKRVATISRMGTADLPLAITMFSRPDVSDTVKENYTELVNSMIDDYTKLVKPHERGMRLALDVYTPKEYPARHYEDGAYR